MLTTDRTNEQNAKTYTSNETKITQIYSTRFEKGCTMSPESITNRENKGKQVGRRVDKGIETILGFRFPHARVHSNISIYTY